MYYADVIDVDVVTRLSCGITSELIGDNRSIDRDVQHVGDDVEVQGYILAILAGGHVGAGHHQGILHVRLTEDVGTVGGILCTVGSHLRKRCGHIVLRIAIYGSVGNYGAECLGRLAWQNGGADGAFSCQGLTCQFGRIESIERMCGSFGTPLHTGITDTGNGASDGRSLSLLRICLQFYLIRSHLTACLTAEHTDVFLGVYAIVVTPVEFLFVIDTVPLVVGVHGTRRIGANHEHRLVSFRCGSPEIMLRGTTPQQGQGCEQSYRCFLIHINRIVWFFSKFFVECD